MPWEERRRSSSSSLLTPGAMVVPRPRAAGGSSVSVPSMSLMRSPIGCRRLAMPCSSGEGLAARSAPICSTWVSEEASWRTSRGEIRPTTALEAIRSRSPMPMSSSVVVRRSSVERTSSVTIAWRRWISVRSIRGKESQWRRSRPPIAVWVWSMMSRRLFPSSRFIGARISKLRKVKPSRRI